MAVCFNKLEEKLLRWSLLAYLIRPSGEILRYIVADILMDTITSS